MFFVAFVTRTLALCDRLKERAGVQPAAGGEPFGQVPGGRPPGRSLTGPFGKVSGTGKGSATPKPDDAG